MHQDAAERRPNGAGKDSTTTTPFAGSTGADTGMATLTEELAAGAEAPPADAALWAIVLAGGIGSRFWPLSTPERPKQLLALVGDRPLIAESVGRLQPLIPPERVLVLTSRDIADAIHAAIPDVPKANMLVEPRPLGTAAALAWGAQEVARRAGPETIFCSLHADLAVGFPEFFRQTLRQASRAAARDESLVAIGVKATRSETGFGWIEAGSPLMDGETLELGGACGVTRFVEKPNAERAESLLESGALWNAGIFVWRARVVLDALEAHTREVAVGLDALRDGDHERYAEQVQSVSIERGLLERSSKVVVVSGEFGWDDVGTWASLKRARELDDTGNGASGDVHFMDATSNVVHADGCSVVLYGVHRHLVVSLPGVTLVTTLERATDLRAMLESLPDSVRVQHSPPSP